MTECPVCNSTMGALGASLDQTDEVLAENKVLTAKVEFLQGVCFESYLMAGQVGACARILDNLSDAANDRPLRHETFLPVTDDDFAELKALTAKVERLWALLLAILATVRLPRMRWELSVELIAIIRKELEELRKWKEEK